MNKLARLLIAWKQYLASYMDQKDPTMWVFGEWFGKSCGDNCAFFANYIVSKTNNIKVYWLCDKGTDTSILDKRIVVIEKNTSNADIVLKKAGAIFLNQNFLDISSNPFNHYGKSLSVNFWHGFPWKKIGHDAYERDDLLFRIYCKLIDPVQTAKYYITVSDTYSDKLKTAFGVKTKKLIKAGYPRNRMFYSSDELLLCRSIVKATIKKVIPEIDISKMRIVLYMPTFRDKGDKPISLDQYFDNDFKQFLVNNNIVIVQKTHFIDALRKDAETTEIGNIISINDINAATLMAASDILISDYSSCIFDYLLLDRPIIQFIYDYDNYRNKDRGLYFEYEDICCGPPAYNKEELQQAIKQSIDMTFKSCDLRKKRREMLMTYDKEDSCEILYTYICNALKLTED